MDDDRPSIAVAFERRPDRPAAEALAARLGLTLAQRFGDPHDLHLALSGDGRLELRVVRDGHPLRGGHPVAADWLKLDVTSPAGRKINQPLFKAVGVRKGRPQRPDVLDATAGLGEDAWLLTAAGCRVTLLERSPFVHALLLDAHRRAADALPDIAARLAVIHADARSALARLADAPVDQRPDTIYLDPMFPPGRKTAEKKPMRVLRWLVGDDTDAHELLALAQRAATQRVAVKRPRHAPPLGDHAPAHAHHAGKALRFDVYPATRD